MPRKRLHRPNKIIKYGNRKVKSKSNQSIKSTEASSRIDDSPCIDEHHENEHNLVASVTITDVIDIPSPLTSSPDSSHNHELSTPVSVRHKGNHMNQNKTTPITPIDLLRKGHYFLENDCDSSSSIRTAERRRQRAVIILQESQSFSKK